MRKKKIAIKLPIKAILSFIFILGSICLILFYFMRFLYTCEYFTIKNVIVLEGQDNKPQPAKQNSVAGLLGKNIFKINLRKEKRQLTKLYPDYESVVVSRRLPNAIIVNFNPRKAIAKINFSNEYFYIDEKGILFSSCQDKNDLPLITGLDSRIILPHPGLKYNNSSLLVSLKFIDDLNSATDLSQYIKIREFDLANINDVILFSSTGCKINLGSVTSFDRDLEILNRLIKEIDSDLSKVKYIDLRFKEPIIKYK